MKTSFLLPALFLLIFMTSCDKEDPDPVAEVNIANITLADFYTVGQTAEINLTITKPTPCHTIEKDPVTTSGNTYSYNFRLINTSEVCIQVLARDESVKVDFEPAEAGAHTLNFYIDGELFETRTVLVTE